MFRKEYSLSFTLDNKPEISIDLITFNSLRELDEFIQNKFTCREDVQKEYNSVMGEFALSYMNKIQDEDRRNNYNRCGLVVILEKSFRDNKLLSIRRIKVLYKGDVLPPRKTCISLIRESLEDDEKLKTLFNKKRYLLSDNEIELIAIYLFRNIPKYKESAIGFFTRNIRDADDDEAYYYCRHLANLCNLVKIKKEGKKK